MIDYQYKRKVRKFFYSKITLVVLLILVIFLGKEVYNIYSKQRSSGDSLSSVVKRYESLESRATLLDSEIKRLKTEEGIEEEIRDKFSVAKPGEQVVVIINGSNTKQVADEGGHKSWWQRFIDWFR